MNTRLFTFLFLVLCSLLSEGYAQVTIGMGEAPEKGALLQLKDTVSGDGGITATTGGLLLPRVRLTNMTELYPFYTEGAVDYTGEAKKKARQNHSGLVVYNLHRTEDLNPGPYYWDGEQWNFLKPEMENATFDPVKCTDIVANGIYIKDAATTSKNYLTMSLNVVKTGTFTFTATSGNGYSFYLSGVALDRGPMTVHVLCQGTPVNIQRDKLTFTGINLSPDCEPEIQVLSSVAEYSLNCSSIAVNGRYEKGKKLTSSNTITLNITVASAGSYSVTTPLTNGVHFSAIGNLSVGTQSITLTGSGSPTVNTDFPVTIQANTPQGNSSCLATVPVILPAMTYAIIGGSEDRRIYSWAAPSRIQALTGGNFSFAPDGIVKIAGFTELWRTQNVRTAANRLENDIKKPDVVLYFAYDASPDITITNALVNYIKKGGCVIYGSSDGKYQEVNTLMEGIFGIRPAIAQSGNWTESDDVYPISNLPDDSVINGPFGNLSSRHWGEDNESKNSVIMRELPPNSVQVCTARSASKTGQNPEYSIVWYNNTYNFFYFGDSTGADTNNDNTGAYPSNYDKSGLPLSKYYGPWDGRNQFVYNSALELNAVAWAIRKAAVSGINPH